MINPSFSISQSEINSFKKNGFLLLKSFFSEETVKQMNKLTTSSVEPPKNNYGSGFSKLKYDIGNDDQYLFEMMKHPLFAKTMISLCGENIFFTQGLGFELQKNSSKGFPWHVGTQSFGFQRREDLGYTIWTPLCPIDPKGQRGGMAYIPKDLLSGDFVYQHINLLPDFIKSKMESGEEYSYEKFDSLKNLLLNGSHLAEVLDYHAVEDAFELGDALIFDKYVLHRSVALTEGPIPLRLAYALRFSSTEAHYDKLRVDALRYPRETFNYDVGSAFNDMVCANDGENVYASQYFDSTRAKRKVGLPLEEVGAE